MRMRLSFSRAAALIVFLTASGAAIASAQSPAAASSLPVPINPLELPVLQGIAETIGDAPLVAFGECSHYLLRIHEFSNTLFRYLVEHKGFRVFMLESAWAINDYVTDFINSDKPKIEDWMSFYLNAFGSAPTEQTLLYIRDYNKKHPEDPIHIAGMQPEQPWTDWRELKATLAKAGLELPGEIHKTIERVVLGNQTFVHDIDVIGFHGKMSRAKSRILSDADLKALEAALDQIDRFLAANAGTISRGASPAGYEEAKLRILGLRFYGLAVLPMRDFALVQPNPTAAQIDTLTREMYNRGDAYRFQIIKTQRETRFKDKKIYIWMHNWHAAKRSEAIDTKLSGAPPLGTTSLGTRFFGEFGPAYKVIGSVVADPDFAYKEGQVTIENSFRKFYGERPGYVDVLRPTAAQKSLPLAAALPQLSQIDNMIGGAIVLKDQFDGVVYLPRSGFSINIKR